MGVDVYAGLGHGEEENESVPRPLEALLGAVNIKPARNFVGSALLLLFVVD